MQIWHKGKNVGYEEPSAVPAAVKGELLRVRRRKASVGSARKASAGSAWRRFVQARHEVQSAGYEKAPYYVVRHGRGSIAAKQRLDPVTGSRP